MKNPHLFTLEEAAKLSGLNEKVVRIKAEHKQIYPNLWDSRTDEVCFLAGALKMLCPHLTFKQIWRRVSLIRRDEK